MVFVGCEKVPHASESMVCDRFMTFSAWEGGKGGRGVSWYVCVVQKIIFFCVLSENNTKIWGNFRCLRTPLSNNSSTRVLCHTRTFALRDSCFYDILAKTIYYISSFSPLPSFGNVTRLFWSNLWFLGRQKMKVLDKQYFKPTYYSDFNFQNDVHYGVKKCAWHLIFYWKI